MTTELSLTDSTPRTSTGPSRSCFHLGSSENRQPRRAPPRGPDPCPRPGHADIHHGAGPAAGLVAHDLDLAVGDDVHDAVDVAQHHHPQRHLLDRAALAAGLDHVAQPELVLEEDEEAGDDVLDQALRPEGDREAEDSGAGEDGPMSMKTLKVSRIATATMTTRPMLRSSWAIVCPRRSRVVVIASSPSSTASRCAEPQPDDPVRQEGQEPDAEDAGAAPRDSPGVDPEDLGCAGGCRRWRTAGARTPVIMGPNLEAPAARRQRRYSIQLATDRHAGRRARRERCLGRRRDRWAARGARRATTRLGNEKRGAARSRGETGRAP